GLSHRNVITIYGFGIERQYPYIVMELLWGRTLRAELASSKRLGVYRTMEILEGVSAAIEEAHRRQFLHRDIKPENIFLANTPTGEVVKVLDFGLAKALVISTTTNTLTAAGTIAGTPCLPRLARGGKLDLVGLGGHKETLVPIYFATLALICSTAR